MIDKRVFPGVSFLVVFSLLVFLLLPHNSTSSTQEKSNKRYLASSTNNVVRKLSSSSPSLDDSSQKRKCVPKICYEPMKFVTDASELNGPLNDTFTLLSSFPGSGNTWFRNLIEQGTGVWSSSVYSDASLIKSGYYGELIDPFETEFSTTSVIKTHYPYSQRNQPLSLYKATRAIHLNRSPLDAMFAEYNRLRGDGHTGTASKMRLTSQDFVDFIDARVGYWRRDMSIWSNHRINMTRLRVQDVVFDKYVLNPNLTMNVLQVQYEEILRDFDVTLLRVFEFLKKTMGKSMPEPEEAVACVRQGLKTGASTRPRLNHIHNFTSVLRSKSAFYNPFTDGRGLAVKHVKKWCEDLAGYYDQEMWGPCNGKLQVERGFSSNIPHKNIAESLPICEGDE